MTNSYSTSRVELSFNV